MRPEEEAEVGGQSQRSSAPRRLGAEAAARDMDVAEGREASAGSADGASSRPRPDGWETWPSSKRAHWRRKRARKMQQDTGPE